MYINLPHPSSFQQRSVSHHHPSSFEAGFHHGLQHRSPELTMQPPMYWDYKYVPPHTVKNGQLLSLLHTSCLKKNLSRIKF